MKSIILLILCIGMLSAQTFEEFARIGKTTPDVRFFSAPRALSFAPDGTLFIVDTGNSRIQLLDSHGQLIRSIGGFGFKDDQFDQPWDIWTRSSLNFYVADYENQRAVRYDKNMNFLSALYSPETGDEAFQFREVASVALNSQNEMFLLEQGENKIIKYDRSGQPERIFGAYESGAGELIEPVQLEIVGIDKLAVSDRGAKAVIFFDFFGNFIRRIEYKDFRAPSGLAVDTKMRMYVADPVARAIFRIDEHGTISGIQVKLESPLIAPQDVACFQEARRPDLPMKLYILDGNQLIIGNLLDD